MAWASQQPRVAALQCIVLEHNSLEPSQNEDLEPTCPPVRAYAKHPLPIFNTLILDSSPPRQWSNLPSINPTYIPSYSSQSSSTVLTQVQRFPQLRINRMCPIV